MPASPPDLGRAALADVLCLLESMYGHEPWVWDPAHVRDPMDVIAGAVLVQHTAWTNAERALDELRAAGVLDPVRLAAAGDEELIPLVRVSGTPSVKARRLRAVAHAIVEAEGIRDFLALQPDALRARLNATHGIGPETRDAIMLYAAHVPVFVIDAYTRRVFRRIGTGPEPDSYEAWQRWFEDRLPPDVRAWQRHHAHIVLHAKARCRAKPLCPSCPLSRNCDFANTR